MNNLKIWFTDMWGFDQYNFNPSRNYFYSLFSLFFSIELDPISPDLLIYSCFGEQHLNYNCKKLFFTGENTVPHGIKRQIYPNYEQCSVSLSFFPTSSYNLYFPLWVLFVNWFHSINPIPLPSNPTFLVEKDLLVTRSQSFADEVFTHKKNCMFMNNNPIPDRVKLFHSLSDRFFVSSYGSLFNNMNGPVRGSEYDKHQLMKEYRSIISFENSFRMGYNTEKLIQPYAEYCIPIYSGGLDRSVFNPEAFILAEDSTDHRSFVESICTILANKDCWVEKACQPLFRFNQIPENFEPLFVLNWLCNALSL